MYTFVCSQNDAAQANGEFDDFGYVAQDVKEKLPLSFFRKFMSNNADSTNVDDDDDDDELGNVHGFESNQGLADDEETDDNADSSGNNNCSSNDNNGGNYNAGDRIVDRPPLSAQAAIELASHLQSLALQQEQLEQQQQQAQNATATTTTTDTKP